MGARGREINIGAFNLFLPWAHLHRVLGLQSLGSRGLGPSLGFIEASALALVRFLGLGAHGF